MRTRCMFLRCRGMGGGYRIWSRVWGLAEMSRLWIQDLMRGCLRGIGTSDSFDGGRKSGLDLFDVQGRCSVGGE